MSLSSYPAANLSVDARSPVRLSLRFSRGRWATRSGGIIVGGDGPSRRSFFKLLAATPLLSQIAARDLYAQATNAMGIGAQQNVYSRLGVKTVINCRGTWTYLSGSLEFPEVRQAQ